MPIIYHLGIEIVSSSSLPVLGNHFAGSQRGLHFILQNQMVPSCSFCIYTTFPLERLQTSQISSSDHEISKIFIYIPNGAVLINSNIDHESASPVALLHKNQRWANSVRDDNWSNEVSNHGQLKSHKFFLLFQEEIEIFLPLQLVSAEWWKRV